MVDPKLDFCTRVLFLFFVYCCSWNWIHTLFVNLWYYVTWFIHTSYKLPFSLPSLFCGHVCFHFWGGVGVGGVLPICWSHTLFVLIILILHTQLSIQLLRWVINTVPYLPRVIRPTFIRLVFSSSEMTSLFVVVIHLLHQQSCQTQLLIIKWVLFLQIFATCFDR